MNSTEPVGAKLKPLVLIFPFKRKKRKNTKDSKQGQHFFNGNKVAFDRETGSSRKEKKGEESNKLTSSISKGKQKGVVFSRCPIQDILETRFVSPLQLQAAAS